LAKPDLRKGALAAAGLLASLFLKEPARDADLAMTDAKIVLN
jgi:hypothetical protein